MELLYIQSLDLIKLYYKEIPKNKINPLKYFLFPKTWLDNYKSKYNYSAISQKIDLSKFIDFNSYKENLGKNEINNNKLINELKKVESQMEKGSISTSKSKIMYPKDFIPVKQEVFYNINYNYLYDIIIGEKNIFIFDNNSNKNIFICSLKFNEYNEDITDFVVNVDSIIILNDKTKNREKKKLFNYISENKGLKNYYKERKIDIYKKAEQNIYDKEDEEIGIFYKINDNNEDLETPQGFNEEYANENILEQDEIRTSIVKEDLNYSKNEIKRNNNNQHNAEILGKINKDMPVLRRNTKCITIYGDIYYYFKRHEYKNNTFISQYDESENYNNYLINNNFNNY